MTVGRQLSTAGVGCSAGIIGAQPDFGEVIHCKRSGVRGAAAIPVGAGAVTMGRRENPAFATRQMLHELPNSDLATSYCTNSAVEDEGSTCCSLSDGQAELEGTA